MASVTTSSCAFMESLERCFTLFANASVDFRIFPDFFCMLLMPFDSGRRFVPCSCGGNDILEHVPARLRAALWCEHVIAHMLASALELKVRWFIVEWIFVFVMDDHTLWDRAEIIDIDLSMK